MTLRSLAKDGLYQSRRARVLALGAVRGLPWLRARLHLPANTPAVPWSEDPFAAGLRVIPLDPGERYERTLPRLEDGEGVLGFYRERRNESVSPTSVTEIVDGLAWGHTSGAVFTADQRFIPAFSRDPYGPALHTVWTRWRLPAPRRLRGRVLYAVTPEATDNFHHWMIDLLPRLGLVERAGYRLQDFDTVILNTRGRRYQRESLARLGIAWEKVLPATPQLHVRADLLVVPSLQDTNQCLPPSSLRFLRRTFFDGTTRTDTPRRLYLSRRDAGFRRLTNEGELEARLKDHGFDVVTPSAFPLDEQARLFAGAEVIAGPGGAALANLVFASPAAQALEISPPRWMVVYHWMISARLGIPHHLLSGDRTRALDSQDIAGRNADFHLSPARLDHALTSLAHPVPAPSP